MTAVEYLSEQIRLTNIEGLRIKLWDAIEKDKEMQKEQKIEFACAVYDKYNFGPQEISFREECEQFKSE